MIRSEKIHVLTKLLAELGVSTRRSVARTPGLIGREQE